MVRDLGPADTGNMTAAAAQVLRALLLIAAVVAWLLVWNVLAVVVAFSIQEIRTDYWGPEFEDPGEFLAGFGLLLVLWTSVPVALYIRHRRTRR